MDANALFGGRVPIVIGVTGHRDLGGNEAAITDAVARECRELRKHYPHTPFLVLSALAEGADQLVANILIRELKAKLFAVLPLPVEEYVKDFTSEASRTLFDALLAKAVRRVNVFKTPPPINCPDKLRSYSGKNRDKYYACAGGLIAEQTQILFAIWDGESARGTGGTADVVDWFTQGYAPKCYSAFPADLSPLDPAEPGLRIHINPTTMRVQISPQTRWRKKPKANGRASHIHQILKRTERFNCDLQNKRAAILKNRPLLIKSEVPSNPPYDFASVFRISDALAVHSSTVVRNYDLFIFALALPAVFFFNTIDKWPFSSLAYLLTSGCIVISLIMLWFSSHESRYVEYRGLAEAMRVLFFWRISGIKKPVWLSYLSKYTGVVHWLRHAVRAIEFSEDTRPQHENTSEGVAAAAHWIESQVKYYTEKSDERWLHYRRWILVAHTAFLLSFVIAVTLSVGAYISMTTAPEGIKWLIEWKEGPFSISLKRASEFLQVELGLLAAAGIATRAFLARRRDFELAKQYAAALQIFTCAKNKLDTAMKAGSTTDWTPQEIIEKLGREALLEQAEWLWVQHSRPFEMPS
jgi:hypothetical protein